jgi:hypothetical protein
LDKPSDRQGTLLKSSTVKNIYINCNKPYQIAAKLSNLIALSLAILRARCWTKTASYGVQHSLQEHCTMWDFFVIDSKAVALGDRILLEKKIDFARHKTRY